MDSWFYRPGRFLGSITCLQWDGADSHIGVIVLSLSMFSQFEEEQQPFLCAMERAACALASNAISIWLVSISLVTRGFDPESNGLAQSQLD